MKIAIITAGGAGMFCGSCMQDNTLARSLRLAGADALLIPTYTPIRVDEENVSSERVFLGGINVYLDSKLPGWRFLPRAMRSWLDRPAVVRFLSKRSSSTNAADLGSLTVDLLNGTHGPQRAEIGELIRFLCDDLRPDVILFSNALLSGVVPVLRAQFSGRLWCMLQGDDIFLSALREPWRSKSLKLVSDNARHFDGFLTHSQYYAEFMQSYLSLPSAKFQTIPLCIEPPPEVPASGGFQSPDVAAAGPSGDSRPPLAEKQTPPTLSASDRITVGYFARICPEKGAWNFLKAAEAVLPRRPDLQMLIGGYLPELHRAEFERRSASLLQTYGDRFQVCGSPNSREEKFSLLRRFNWLCVPTDYHEPKGLYVLEAALAGVPSILPNHGAFPERIHDLGAGQLYDPSTPDALTQTLLNISPPKPGLAEQLSAHCLEHYSLATAGERFLQTIRST